MNEGGRKALTIIVEGCNGNVHLRLLVCWLMMGVGGRLGMVNYMWGEGVYHPPLKCSILLLLCRPFGGVRHLELRLGRRNIGIGLGSRRGLRWGLGEGEGKGLRGDERGRGSGGRRGEERREGGG